MKYRHIVKLIRVLNTEEIEGTSFDHDANGNLIEKDDGVVVTGYEWNDKNGLIGMTVDESTVWQATYYPNGTRESKTNTDGSILYLYDGKKPIGTYETDWTRRESFGYGFGSNDPMLNVQYDGGESAYYYVKDGLGNVNLIMNAGGTTEATVGLNACGVPAGDTGAFRSDVDFAGGGWAYDPDIGAYINYTDTETGKYLGARIFYDEECDACLTEIGLPPWEKPEDDEEEEDPSGPIVVAWPPFASPLPGNPVTLDAGDAGFGLAGNELCGVSGTVNPDARHCNGIDWAARAYQDRCLSIADFKTTIRHGGNDMSFSNYDASQRINQDFRMSIDYEMTKRYFLPRSELPDKTPSWRANGPGTGIRYAGYRHQFREQHWPNSAEKIDAGTGVSLTNRLANDSNTGPHLHLYLKDSIGTLDANGMYRHSGAGADTAWQEKYFPALPEVPLHIYLTAICRYGWIQGKFGSYSNDWDFTWGAPPSLHCMHTGERDMMYHDLPSSDGKYNYTYGDCASRCHGAVAHWLGGSSHCEEAHRQEEFYNQSGPRTKIEHTGCAACCDERFSEFLLNYSDSWASEYGLPMDNLANATREGHVYRIVNYGDYLGYDPYYEIPWYIFAQLAWQYGTSVSYDFALTYMGEEMLMAWQIASDNVGGKFTGTTCAEVGQQWYGGPPPGHDQGPGWCERAVTGGDDEPVVQ